MKNLYFFIVIIVSLLSFPNSAFGQNDKKNAAYFDFEIQDYVVYFDVSEENPDTLISPRMYFPQQKNILDNSGKDYGYPAEFRKGKIYLSNPSQINLREGVGSYCYARFYNKSRNEQKTKELLINPPDLKCVFDWVIEDKKVSVTARILGMEDLIPSIKSFRITDPYAEFKKRDLKIIEADYDGDKTFKAVGDFQDFDSKIPKYVFLNFYLELKDSRGISRVDKLFENKVLILFRKSELTVGTIVNEGFTPHWDSYEPENGFVVNSFGKVVLSFVAYSGEFQSFDDTKSPGFYIIKIPNVGEVKILKINF